MPLTLPRTIFASASDHADPIAVKSALPTAFQHAGPLLPALRVKAQLASYVSMTRAFMTKTLPKSKPLTLPMHGGAVSERRSGGDGKISELVVIAVRRVARVDEQSRSSVECSGRGRATSYWASSFRLREQQQRIQCSLRYGESHKQSRMAESATSVFAVDEKFAFGRREGAPVYEEAVIELLAPPSAPATVADQSLTLGHLVIDVEREFLSVESDSSGSAEPIHRSGVLASADGSAASWEVDYVLHRLPVETSAAEAAAESMAHSTCSVDDDGDLEAFGAAFPHLWYMF